MCPSPSDDILYNHSKGFSASALLTFWARYFLVGDGGGCLVHCVIFSSILGLYLLDVGSTPLDLTNRTVSRCYPVSPIHLG